VSTKQLHNDDQLTLLGSTSELQQFFADHARDSKIFPFELRFAREESLLDWENQTASGLMRLASVTQDLRSYDRSVSAAQDYLRLRPGDPAGHMALALSLLAQNQPAAVDKHITEFFNLCRDSSWLPWGDDRWSACPRDPDTVRHRTFGLAHFAARDFAASANEFAFHLQKSDSVQASDVAWYLLALDTQGEPGRQTSRDVVTKYAGLLAMPVTRDLDAYLRGTLSDSDFVKKASEYHMECELYSYAGSHRLALGDKIGAREFFAKSLSACAGSTLFAIIDSARLRQLAVN